MTLKRPVCPDISRYRDGLRLAQNHSSDYVREQFHTAGRPVFPCIRCVDADHCKVDRMFVDCSALNAYKVKMRRRRLGR